MSSVSYQDKGGQDLTALPTAYTNRWVRSVELPAGQFLVQGRIPYGIWSHAAPPGGYKSAFASQIEHHITHHHPIPGLDWEFLQHGDCLVIAPDESIYEIQERELRIMSGGSLPSDGFRDDAHPTAGEACEIHYRHAPTGTTLQQRIAWMMLEIEQIEELTGRKIVWVRWDTVGSLLGARADTDAYTAAMPLQTLNAWLANTARILFLPNHIGKDGRSIGTVGVDGSSNLKTETELTRASNEGTLTVAKMRGGHVWEAALKMKNGLLELDDLSPQQASHALGTQPREVLNYLVQCGPSTSAQILNDVGIPKDTCYRVIMRLKAGGEISNASGLWDLTDKGRTSPPPENPSSGDSDTSDRHDTGDRHDTSDTSPAPSWWTCPRCGTATAAGAACTTPICRTEPVPPREVLIEAAHETIAPRPRIPAQTVPANAESRSMPAAPWRQMAGRRGPAPVELPQIDATWRMDGKTKVWNSSPIAAAIDLIMADRDAGRLSPKWRTELPAEVRESGIEIIDGGHGHGDLPHRYRGEITKQPAGPWCSYDVYGSFLAAYKTHLSIRELVRYDGDWTPKAAGLVLQITPEWNDPRIGHPYGHLARPGELQYVWQPTMRLAMKLAAVGAMAMPQIQAMYLRVGYQQASEALLEGFYNRMKKARETYPRGSDELEYTKAMYSQFLSSAEQGKRNVFRREDWTGSIRSEAFGPRLWGNGWRAVQAGAELLGMGNTDELCFRPAPVLDELFPAEDPRIGKMKLKDKGGEQ